MRQPLWWPDVAVALEGWTFEGLAYEKHVHVTVRDAKQDGDDPPLGTLRLSPRQWSDLAALAVHAGATVIGALE